MGNKRRYEGVEVLDASVYNVVEMAQDESPALQLQVVAPPQKLISKVNIVRFNLVIDDPSWLFNGTTFRVPVTGSYMVRAQVNYDNNAVTTALVRNGVLIDRSIIRQQSADVITEIKVNRGDLIQMISYHHEYQIYQLLGAKMFVTKQQECSE